MGNWFSTFAETHRLTFQLWRHSSPSEEPNCLVLGCWHGNHAVHECVCLHAEMNDTTNHTLCGICIIEICKHCRNMNYVLEICSYVPIKSYLVLLDC